VKVVAELGASHGGSLLTALDLMYAAKEAGCDAFKLQTLTPENIAAPGVRLTKGPWAGRELRDLYREVMTPWEWHHRLFWEGKKLGIEVFSTAFDPAAVAFLEELDTPRYKIASPEISDYPLIEAIAATGKPVYVSDGLASAADLRKAALVLSGRQVTILRCVSEYPADPADFGLKDIAYVTSRWGLSDHSLTTTAAVVATAMRASVLEKHIRMKDDVTTPDCRFALTPDQMKETVQAVRDTVAMMTAERPANGSHGGLKKSLWIIKPVEAGDVASDANVRALRPDDGCDPFLWPVLKGGRFRASHPANVPLEEAMISLDDERT
jgi:pseudaminic acid synthase